MVQLIVSQSPYSKAAKMFKKSAIFKQQSFTQHSLCCKARDLEFWEAVGRVPFDQRKFRKFEPVIFVEWKAPLVNKGIIPSGQDSSILPARVANHSARFASSCPLTEPVVFALSIAISGQTNT